MMMVVLTMVMIMKMSKITCRQSSGQKPLQQQEFDLQHQDFAQTHRLDLTLSEQNLWHSLSKNLWHWLSHWKCRKLMYVYLLHCLHSWNEFPPSWLYIWAKISLMGNQIAIWMGDQIMDGLAGRSNADFLLLQELYTCVLYNGQSRSLTQRHNYHSLR